MNVQSTRTISETSIESFIRFAYINKDKRQPEKLMACKENSNKNQ